MVSEIEVNIYVDRFIDYIKSTDEYRNYMRASRNLDKNPDIKEKVDQYKKENYFLQHAPENEDIFDRVQEMQFNNKELLERGDVSEYLVTEWEFFHMIQKIFGRIMDNMDF